MALFAVFVVTLHAVFFCDTSISQCKSMLYETKTTKLHVKQKSKPIYGSVTMTVETSTNTCVLQLTKTLNLILTVILTLTLLLNSTQ